MKQMKQLTSTVIIILSLLFAIGRIFIKPRLINIPTVELSYEAFAHIFVGYLIGSAIQLQLHTTGIKIFGVVWFIRDLCTRNLYFQCAIFISLFELAAFLVQKAII